MYIQFMCIKYNVHTHACIFIFYTCSCILCVDTVSIVISYEGLSQIIEEAPPEHDFPTHENLYVIQETAGFQLATLDILCYNFENDSVNDTEVTFANPNLAEIGSFPSRNLVRVSLVFSFRQMQFPPSFNGNVTCRSRATGRESTIFIASKQFSVEVICMNIIIRNIVWPKKLI